MTGKSKKPKGEKFKAIELDGNEAAILLSLMRQAPHEDSSDEVALEIIETLEALGDPVEAAESANPYSLSYIFPEPSPVIVSIAAHNYLPNVFTGLKPNGLILKQYVRIKRAIKNAEKVYDGPLMEGGWNRDDGVWFPPENGPVLPEKGDQEPEKKAGKAEGEGETAA